MGINHWIPWIAVVIVIVDVDGDGDVVVDVYVDFNALFVVFVVLIRV